MNGWAQGRREDDKDKQRIGLRPARVESTFKRAKRSGYRGDMRKFEMVVAVFMLASPVLAIDPPKGLHWGDNLGRVEAALWGDPDKVTLEPGNKDKPRRGYREYSEMWLPKGFSRHEIKNAKVNGKKAERTELFLDSAETLRSFHYIFLFDNDETGNKVGKGYRKAWVFHSELKALLIQKYGAPKRDEATEDERDRVVASGSKYATIWSDSTGSKVTLYITRQTHDAVIAVVDAFLVLLIYDSPGYQPDLLHRDSTDSRDI
jgi:hypothetical protein